MKTRKEHRIERLGAALRARKTLHIRDAAEMLDVSEMTIRRDIRENPDLFGFLGGYIISAAESVSAAPYDLAQQADINPDAKRSACQHALVHVQPQSTVFVDCGTTLAHLVHSLPHDAEITLICYALNIADLAVRRPGIRLVLLGGAYHAPTASFHPLDETPDLSALAIHTAFFSAAGFDHHLGASCTTFEEARLKRAAMARAQRSVLVIDNSKIGKVSPASFAQPDDFDVIVTETGSLPRA